MTIQNHIKLPPPLPSPFPNFQTIPFTEPWGEKRTGNSEWFPREETEVCVLNSFAKRTRFLCQRNRKRVALFLREDSKGRTGTSAAAPRAMSRYAGGRAGARVYKWGRREVGELEGPYFLSPSRNGQGLSRGGAGRPAGLLNAKHMFCPPPQSKIAKWCTKFKNPTGSAWRSTV